MFANILQTMHSKIAGIPPIILLFLISQVYLITGTGCANIIPPTGGPKDTIPPRLISVSPRDSMTNFNSKTIVFNFDEYINVDNVQQNVIISPAPKHNPVIDFKLRTLSIKIKDTLQPNTTYFFDFGKAVKDNNEGNILKNFFYVFSTGPSIDSLALSGNVIIAETGKPDSTLIVMLHKNLDDSAVINDRPRYVARLDSAGRFVFHFLAPGIYNLFALKDESGSRKYFSKTTLFAFNDKPLTIGQTNEPVTLYAYSENKEVKKPTVKPTGPAKKEEKNKRLAVQTNLSAGELDLLGNLEIEFQNSLKAFDSTRVHLKDGNFKDLFFQLTRDTNNKKITIAAKWAPDSPYHAILEKDFAEDSLGNKLLKADTIKFRTKKESSYGEIRLRFKNLDLSKNPVLQFVQNNVVKFSYPLTSNQLIKKLFVPGDYDLRILNDDNKNGVWDPGEFFGKHKEPEKVIPIIIPLRNKKRIFTVRGGGWENDYDFTL